MIGTTLNHYRVTDALGQGGMGEVYAAEDTKLHRRVALKVLPPTVADDPERRQRFEREARAVAALNHPNIVTIHSIEQADDRLFLTMELVHGRTLSQLIPRGGMRLDAFLKLAIPLADAVSVAHQHGIIHRDLKPDNIMVTDDGRLKVLDFGLAQLKEVARDADGVTTFRTQQLTGEGRVMGTVAYMSPEQAEGKNVDARSDIFSLGVVLFEMATGDRPFKGETAMSVLSSIMKDPAPSISALNSGVPGELARIVRRSLAKDPARRQQSALDVRNDLEDLRHEVESGHTVAALTGPGAQTSRAREWLAWGLAAVMAIAALVALLRPSPIPDRAADVMSILPPGDTTLTEGESPQVSPNGQTIAFVATDVSGRTRLYVRDRSAPAARALEETDDASQPFWSPDSRSIGFFAASRLKRVSLAGGRPQTLARAPVPRGGTWNRDDVIVFVPSPEQSPRRIAAAGGDATALPVQPGVPRWLPVFLPDGRHYLYIQGQRGNVSIGSIETPDATDLMPSHTNVTFLEPGYLMFRRDESLFVQRFNAASRRLEGAAVVLADKVSFNPITRQMMASASNDGFLTYVGAGRQWHLTWFDREGRRLTNAGTIGGYNSLCLTADGKRVIYDVADPVSGNVDLWSLDLADGRTTHLTFHPFPEFYVVCSPTTDEIIFSAARKGTPNLYRLLLSSPGAETLLRESSRPELTTQWSRDGKFLLFSVFSPETDFDIWMQPLTGDAPVALIATEATETGGQLAPNGRWIAYSAGQAGNHEVYVQPLPSNGTRWQVSRGGGRQPQWRPDGRQLYYISLDKKLIAVDVDTSGPQFVNGASRVLVDTRVGGWERTHLGNPYGISANGERVLVANAGEETLPISVLVNWQSMMRP